MQKKHLSFQETIQGGISTFLIDSGMSACAAERDGLASVIDSLASYQEEGQRLYPKIILSENLRNVKLLLAPSEEIVIGSGLISEETYLQCLKKCAPLATGDWYIFIERSSTEVRYGLIRGGDGILSPTPEARMPELSLDANNTPMIVIRPTTERTVEATTSKNQSLSISFSGRVNTAPGRVLQLGKLFDVISNSTQDEVRQKLPSLLARIFNRVREQGHGTLAVVVPHGRIKRPKDRPKGLTDGNWLDKSVDLSAKVEALIQSFNGEAPTNSESLVSASAIIAVVSGMLMTDGITVFDDAGHVLAFNVFAKPITRRTNTVQAVRGGARRRTYELLSSWVGSDLIACFMLSHDGGTYYHQRED